MEGLIEVKELNVNTMKKEFIDFVDVNKITMQTYINGIDNFAQYLNKNGITRPERKDVINWRNDLIETHSCNTANTYLVGVKSFFGFLELKNMYFDITRNVKGAKISSLPKKNVLILQQVKDIYNNLSDLREKALWGLLFTTGLRGTEVANAKIEDIKEYNGEICLFVKCKGHQEYDEYVKLADNVLNDLKSYIGDRQSGYIFVSGSNNNKNGGVTIKTIRQWLKKIFIRFGIDDETISLHSSRRTFACISYKLGKSIYDIKSVLHHKSIQTTTRYLQQVDRNDNNTEKLVASTICG